MIIRDGRVEAIGAPAAMISRYMSAELLRDRPVRNLEGHPGRTRGSAPLMSEVQLRSRPDGLDGAAKMGGSLSVQARFAVPYPVRPILGVTIKTANGAPILGVSNRWTRAGFEGPALTRGTISCSFERLPLMPGAYMLDLYFGDFADITRDLDVIIDALALEVFPADIYGTGMIPRPMDGPVFCDASWNVAAD
ncbi:MAG: Wzt carbohydrate-binding domain-containing protein [Candidatus Binataceae bacterium]